MKPSNTTRQRSRAPSVKQFAMPREAAGFQQGLVSVIVPTYNRAHMEPANQTSYKYFPLVGVLNFTGDERSRILAALWTKPESTRTQS